MSVHTLDGLIPTPQKVTFAPGVFPIQKLSAVSVPPEAAASFQILKRACGALKLFPVESGEPAAVLVYGSAPGMAREGWKLTISPDRIFLQAPDANGFLYGTFALIQMLVIALRKGRAAQAVLECGSVEDAPRFEWRGFMLDSARHFQTPETLRKLLFFLAASRINTFHWHLSDHQAWRWETKQIPGLAGKGENEDGFYTQNEIGEITVLAEKLGIRIIPELDLPGHAHRLLAVRPDLACDPAAPGLEVCIGNPETLPQLKKIIAELMELFPHSPVIHIGGDEAGTAAWEKCPRCQAALKKKGLSTFRQLENSFMEELVQFVLSKGRTPMMWSTASGQRYDRRTVMQAWLDIRDPLRLAKEGSKVVYSVHNSLYFDYPAQWSEPHENWMFELSEQGVYMTDPHLVWADQLKEAVLGTEACLWTESVPEWRLLQKILPRILAYSECVWSLPEKKDYGEFVRRRELLESAGYWDVLRTC